MVLLIAFLWFVFIIGIVVFIHEFGHFIVAKLTHTKVEEFAFGFGKKLLGKKIGDTLYKINLIPLGGYVMLLGEEKVSKKQGSFSAKSIGARALIIAAGVFMNLLLAVVIFYIVLPIQKFEVYFPIIANYKFLGARVTEEEKPVIEGVIDGTEASRVNFPTNVIVWSADDTDIGGVDDFLKIIEENQNKEISIKVLSIDSGNFETVAVTPNNNNDKGVLLGVQFDDVVAPFYKLDYSHVKPLSGVVHSVNFIGYNLAAFKELVVISVKERSVKPVSSGVVGVVGVADVILSLVKVGNVIDLFVLLAGVNLMLAVANIIPIPGFDGGHLFFIVLEKLRGRKIAEKYQQWAIRIGFLFSILLGVTIAVKDLIQFNVFSRLIHWIQNLF